MTRKRSSGWCRTYRTYNLTHHDALVKTYEGVVDEIRRLKNSGKGSVS